MSPCVARNVVFVGEGQKADVPGAPQATSPAEALGVQTSLLQPAVDLASILHAGFWKGGLPGAVESSGTSSDNTRGTRRVCRSC